eukprot:2462312-Pleurochrysis_carterae.AAC.4
MAHRRREHQAQRLVSRRHKVVAQARRCLRHRRRRCRRAAAGRQRAEDERVSTRRAACGTRCTTSSHARRQHSGLRVLEQSQVRNAATLTSGGARSRLSASRDELARAKTVPGHNYTARSSRDARMRCRRRGWPAVSSHHEKSPMRATERNAELDEGAAAYAETCSEEARGKTSTNGACVRERKNVYS